MTQADLGTDRRVRWGVAALVALIHLMLIAGLIRAFTPRLADTVVAAVGRALTVTVSSPPPRPKAAPTASARPDAGAQEGSAGAAGKKASPRAAAAPPATIAVKPTPAPPVAGTGDENASGGGEAGTGTGAAGQGRGTGSGLSGSGQGSGGGAASPTVKIAGDINSARDYPRAGRDLRIGAAVTIDLTIGTEGRVKACRIVQASPDPDADRVTCELATKRFRFRPALGASGQPVEATYRWRQRWFY